MHVVAESIAEKPDIEHQQRKRLPRRKRVQQNLHLYHPSEWHWDQSVDKYCMPPDEYGAYW